jgi:CheY-like chemotaxis protein
MLDSSSQCKWVNSGCTRPRPRILIADGYVLIAEACKGLLEPEFHVVGIASDGRKLLELMAKLEPDVVILDISMPGLNGLDAGTKIKAAKRDTKLVYVTAASGSDVAAVALGMGAGQPPGDMGGATT